MPFVSGGELFKVSASGNLTVVHAFGSSPGDADAPRSGLIAGSDGYLYGITNAGGTADVGSIYRVNPSTGDFAVLYSFCSTSPCDAFGPGPRSRKTLTAHSSEIPVATRTAAATSSASIPVSGKKITVTTPGRLGEQRIRLHGDVGSWARLLRFCEFALAGPAIVLAMLGKGKSRIATAIAWSCLFQQPSNATLRFSKVLFSPDEGWP